MDRDGAKIGTVDEIYLDADSGEPEWALVHTGLFGSKRNFVPLAGDAEVEGALPCRWPRTPSRTRRAWSPTGGCTTAEEKKLYSHYGLEAPKQEE